MGKWIFIIVVILIILALSGAMASCMLVPKGKGKGNKSNSKKSTKSKSGLKGDLKVNSATKIAGKWASPNGSLLSLSPLIFKQPKVQQRPVAAAPKQAKARLARVPLPRNRVAPFEHRLRAFSFSICILIQLLEMSLLCYILPTRSNQVLQCFLVLAIDK